MGSGRIYPLDLRIMLADLQLKYTHIYIPAMFIIWLGLFIDSVGFTQFTAYGQDITNGLVLLVFLWIFFHVSRVTRILMLVGVPIALAGEMALSLGLGMYTYRLNNVPHYVPLGHAIVYAAVYYITKEPWVRKHQQSVIRFLYISMVVYSTMWLVFAGDVLGFLGMLSVVVLFRFVPHTQLFFLVMFFMVVYLELWGTHYGNWVWPPVWFDTLTWIPSANPPSGIGVAYFLFDASCLLAYKFLNTGRWQRVRSLQAQRKLVQEVIP